MRRLGYVAIAIAVGGTTVHLATSAATGGDPGEFVNSWVYCAVILAAGLACLARAAAIPRDRLAWSLIGVGTLSWAGAEFLWYFHVADLKPQPYPSIADLFYLLNYPLEITGVILLARGRIDRWRAGLALDSAIAACGAAALGAALLGPALADLAAKNVLRTIVDASYPIFDVAVIGCVVGVLAVVGRRRDVWVLLAAIAVVAAADTIYLYQEAAGTYTEGTLLDSTWLLGAACFALAAWQPASEPGRHETRHGIVVPAAAALMAVALLVADHYSRLSGVAVILASITLVLALARLVLVFRDNAALLGRARLDAVTDSLTGLGNRRHLVKDLDGAVERARRGEAPFVVAIFDLDGFKTYNDTFGHAAGDLLLRRMGNSLRAAVAGHGQAYRLGGDEFCVLAPLPNGRVDSVIAAAAAALKEDGEGFSITCSHGRALVPGEASESSAALRLADRRLYAEKGRSTRSFDVQARDLLLGVLREREPDLRVHMEGVGALASELGRRVGLEAEEVDVIGRSAELHDVGKMAIPDDVLAKPGPLSDQEWRLMRTHTLVGERMLSVLPALAPVAKLIRSSHERWDGDGYPDGLRAEEIPVGARIIAICDAFEAMTEKRPYRNPLTVEEALTELRDCAATQFDPHLVELFCQLVSDGATTEAVERA